MFPSVPRRRTRGAAVVLLATAAAIPAFAARAQATIGPSSGSTAIPAGEVTLETIPFGLVGPPDSPRQVVPLQLGPGEVHLVPG